VSAVTAASEGVYSNDVVYSNLILLPSGERGAGALGGAWSLGAGGQNG